MPSFDSEWFWADWKFRNFTDAIEFMKENYPPGFEYPEFAPMFKAELFDPKAWAELFQKSGAMYVYITWFAFRQRLIVLGHVGRGFSTTF